MAITCSGPSDPSSPLSLWYPCSGWSQSRNLESQPEGLSLCVCHLCSSSISNAGVSSVTFSLLYLCSSGQVLHVDWFVAAHCLSLPFVHCRLSHYTSHQGLTSKCMIWSLPPPSDHCVHLASLSERRKKKKLILPSWLLLSWIFSLRWWWTIALWILVLCK